MNRPKKLPLPVLSISCPKKCTTGVFVIKPFPVDVDFGDDAVDPSHPVIDVEFTYNYEDDDDDDEK